MTVTISDARVGHARSARALLLSLQPLGYGVDEARRGMLAAELLADVVPQVKLCRAPARGDARVVAARAHRHLRDALRGLPAGTPFGRACARALLAATTGRLGPPQR